MLDSSSLPPPFSSPAADTKRNEKPAGALLNLDPSRSYAYYDYARSQSVLVDKYCISMNSEPCHHQVLINSSGIAHYSEVQVVDAHRQFQTPVFRSLAEKVLRDDGVADLLDAAALAWASQTVFAFAFFPPAHFRKRRGRRVFEEAVASGAAFSSVAQTLLDDPFSVDDTDEGFVGWLCESNLVTSRFLESFLGAHPVVPVTEECVVLLCSRVHASSDTVAQTDTMDALRVLLVHGGHHLLTRKALGRAVESENTRLYACAKQLLECPDLLRAWWKERQAARERSARALAGEKPVTSEGLVGIPLARAPLARAAEEMRRERGMCESVRRLCWESGCVLS